MTASRWETIRVFSGIVLATSIAGSAFGAMVDPDRLNGLFQGFFTGFVISTLVSSWEFASAHSSLGRALRRMRFLAGFAVKVLAYVAGILVGYGLGRVLFDLVPVATVFTDPAFARAMTFSMIVSVAVNVVVVLRRMLGRDVLTSLVTGRYHRPRIERRWFLFLDLVGSTTIAERLGPARFLDFLNRVVSDVTDPILDRGGDIHRYVGDEVIVTWTAQRGARNGEALRCYFDCAAALGERRPGYERDFGVAPRVRGALHVGEVVAGEMGASRLEIVFLGDPMNTTARIEEIAKRERANLLVSRDALDESRDAVTSFDIRSIGEVTLRGRERPLELFTVTPSEPTSRPGKPPEAASGVGGTSVP